MAFETILNSSNNHSGALLSNSFGCFDFDAVTIVQHASNLNLTENPIENGTNINDHAILQPKEVTLTGIIVGYTPPFKMLLTKSEAFLEVEYKSSIEVQIMSAIANLKVKQISSTYDNDYRVNNRLTADFLPDYDQVSLDMSESDRIAHAYELLLKIQRSGKVLTLETQMKRYKNMMITSISSAQKNSMSAEFSLTLREVFIVETQIGSGFKDWLGKTNPKQVDSYCLCSD